MRTDLRRSLILFVAWIALTLGIYVILAAVLPGIDARIASLVIVAIIAVLVLAGVAAARWWREVGYTPRREWREPRWFLVPAVITLIPLLAGIRPLDGTTYAVLLAGYALTGIAEETMFRGVLVRLLRDRPPAQVAAITAVLFGLVHLSNIVIRGNPAVIVAQAIGAAAFGFGYAALRLRCNALLPLVVTHMLTDLFLQMGSLPLIPVAVVQDVILFAFGLWLLREGRRNGPLAPASRPGME